MPSDPPTPPRELPASIVDTLEDCSQEQLQAIARYADQLAEHKAREARLKEASDDDDEPDVEDRPDDMPDDVPAKASIVTKEINDNRYHYWQWREGDQIKSKYKAPVDPDE
jgi:hypothetical protein